MPAVLLPLTNTNPAMFSVLREKKSFHCQVIHDKGRYCELAQCVRFPRSMTSAHVRNHQANLFLFLSGNHSSMSNMPFLNMLNENNAVVSCCLQVCQQPLSLLPASVIQGRFSSHARKCPSFIFSSNAHNESGPTLDIKFRVFKAMIFRNEFQ